MRRQFFSRPNNRSMTFLRRYARRSRGYGVGRRAAAGGRSGAEQRDRHGDVGDVARRQHDGDRSAAIIGQAVDFAGPPAPSDRSLLDTPLFEPAAERCAFTRRLWTDSSPGTGPAAATFSNRRCRMPRCDTGCHDRRSSSADHKPLVRRANGILPSAHAGCPRSPSGHRPSACPACHEADAVRSLPRRHPTTRTSAVP